MRTIYEIHPKKNQVVNNPQVNGKRLYVRIPIRRHNPNLPQTFPIPANMIMRMIKENPPSHTVKKIYHYTDQEREEIGRKNHEYIKSLPPSDNSGLYWRETKESLKYLGLELKGLKVYSNLVFTYLYNSMEELGIDTLYSAFLDSGWEDSDLVIEKTKWLPDYVKQLDGRKFLVLSSPKYQTWAKENGLMMKASRIFWTGRDDSGKRWVERGVWYTNIVKKKPQEP